jgi:hypothetical protein
MPTLHPARSLLAALAIVGATAAPVAAAPADSLWREVRPPVVAAAGAPPGRAYLLDETGLAARLAAAPREFSAAARAAPLRVPFPLPDGRLLELTVEESPILAPRLARRHPAIRTYVVRDASGAVGGRLSLTPRGGLQGLLRVAGEVVRIAPEGDDGTYRSVFERDLAPDGPPVCGVEGDEIRSLAAPGRWGPSDPVARVAPAAAGDDLRIYRLAIATTGEYYAARGGNDADVLDSIVTVIDKVNFIYETEVAIRFVLIDDLEDLFFTDPATDGYSNDDECTMEDENQVAIDGVLDDGDYDIGHVFGSGSGGCAGGSNVCVTDQKAQGASNLNTNQPPDQEGFSGYRLVAHEMGHQFGAGHTWSGDSGNCTPGQFSPSNAYEPGGGTTLMAYSGTCGNDNLQGGVPDDPYFHTHSFDQIVAYSTTDDGDDCPFTISTDNDPPAVDAGPDSTIPQETPFVLTGSGNDPDGDSLTFAWEQLDLAAGQGDPGSAALGDGPLFRSYPPVPDPSRTLPNLADLLGNVDTIGEILPTNDRSMTFRLTARDNRAFGGGVDHDTMTVTVEGDAFFIVSPNGGETLGAGCTVPVLWEVGGGDIAAAVDLRLSTDGGFTTAPLALGVANDGAHDVFVPCGAGTTEGRVRADAVANIFFDVSDSDVFILPRAPEIDAQADGGEEGAVDENCEFTLTFSATVTDDCGLDADDVAVATSVLTANASIGTPVWNAVQVDEQTVTVSGTALVSDLTSSPAIARIAVSGADQCGFEALDVADVAVFDATPAEIAVSLAPDLLWPANHKLREVTATVVATDNCPGVGHVLASVVSDEPDDSPGGGDGHTTGDIRGLQLGTPDLAFFLRAERLGSGDGRVYTATYVATDGSGNETAATDEVLVPHHP